ncbi:MAG: hypothetical protein AAF587_26505 [Bacteroidota bacterium]
MKSNLFILSLLASLLLVMSGCKYPQGPALSLQSPEARIANIWKVVAATDEAGEDDTSSFDNRTYTFAEDGSATLTYTLTILGNSQNVNLDGSWNLLDDETNLQLLLQDVTGLITLNEELIITRLTQDELWLQDQTNDLQTIQLEAQE